MENYADDSIDETYGEVSSLPKASGWAQKKKPALSAAASLRKGFRGSSLPVTSDSDVASRMEKRAVPRSLLGTLSQGATRASSLSVADLEDNAWGLRAGKARKKKKPFKF